MIIDFSHQLWRAVAHYLNSSAELGADAQKFLQRWDSPDKLEINKCPKEINAEFSASIVFKIGHFFSRQSPTEQLQPLRIAEALLANLQYEQRSNWFETSLGGGGFVNVSLTDQGKQQFLSLVSADNQLLFSTAESVVGATSRQVMALDQTALQQWDNPMLRAAGSHNLELRQFVDSLSAAGCSFDDFLMLVVCLDDDNHDLLAYQQGLKGSQNIPWYLSRFFCDVRDMALLFDPQHMHDLSEKKIDSAYLQQSLLQARDLICEFRFALMQSLRSIRPEILLGFTLQIVRSFYRYYNYPHLRLLLEQSAKGKHVDPVLRHFIQLAYLQQEIVSQSLSQLRNFHAATAFRNK